MEPSIDLLGVVTLLGASQGILLALALLGLRKGNRKANRLLAMFMACSSVLIIGSLLNSTKYILVYPHLTQIVTPCHFLFGPLFFFYISYSTSGKRSFQKRDILHLMPAALCVAYYLPLYLQGREAKIAYTVSAFENYPPMEWRIRAVLVGLQCIPYMILMYAKVFTLSRNSREPLSSAKRNNLFWLRTFMTMILVAAVAGLFRVVLNFRTESMLLMPICFTIIVYVAGYMAIKHPEALAGVEASSPAQQKLEVTEPVKKYEKSNLTPERAEEYLKRLINFMESEKPYTDGDLTLQKLAEKLSIPVNHLSQIINERLEQNFFDFINGYRVKEVQRMMIDPSKKHYSLIAIAEEVGFNSKSTFNSVFKKHVNMTPSEYRKLSGNSDAAKEYFDTSSTL